MNMNGSLISLPFSGYIDKFFCNARNPMAISKAKDGTYTAVNKAFAKGAGLPWQMIIGQTSVGMGHITASQRSEIVDEIKNKGSAQNIELEVKVKNNEIRRRLINSSLIRTGKDSLLLTIVTDISKHKLAMKKRQNDILFKSLDAIEGTGVILIQDHPQKPSSFFINKEARRALKKRPVADLLCAIDGQKSIHFNTETGFYHVKTISVNHCASKRIILMKNLHKVVSIKEKLRQYALTSRQEEIALLAATGYSNREISEKLFIAEYTVKDHLKEIFQRIGISKRGELCPKIFKWR
jgi:PAS domain S-box-containing protein